MSRKTIECKLANGNILKDYTGGKMSKGIVASHDKLWTWHEGSAQCGKSVAAALGLATIIANAPKGDDLFLAIGYTSTSAKNNVLRCGGYGVQAFFGNMAKEGKYLGNDCLKIQTRNGMKNLVFFGGATVSSNNAFHGWKVSAFVLDEIDRLHPNVIDEVKQRVTTFPNAHIIVTQNPNNPRHPIYKELEFLQNRNLVNYFHWTLDDNAGLTDEQRENIKGRYDPNSIFYRRFVLGERCVAEALIYTVDRSKNVFSEINPSEYIDSVVVIDSGDTVSATSIVLMGLRRGFEGVDVLKEYHHRNADNNDIAFRHTLEDDCNELSEFIKDSIQLLGRRPSAVLFDGSESVEYEIEQSFRRYGINIIPERATKKLKFQYKESESNGWIIDRIRYVSSLLFKGRLRFHSSCTHTIAAFELAQYNPKKLEQGIEERLDEPQNGTLCDELDAVDYGVIYFKDDIERRYE